MTPLMMTVVGSVVRWALTALGTAGVVSDSQEEQIVGGAVAVVMLAWSVWQKHRAEQKRGWF